MKIPRLLVPIARLAMLATLALTCAAPAWSQRVYVTNSNDATVSVIDTSVSPAVVLGAPIGVGTDPFALVASHDGRRLYVANFGGFSVSVVDLQATPPKVIATVSVPNNPLDIAISADDSKVYVATNSGLQVIDATMNPPAIVTAGTVAAGGVALLPDGTTAYVDQFSAGTVTALDIAATPPTPVGSPITVGAEPIGVAAAPDGNAVYVASQSGGDVSVINPTLSPPANVATITVGQSVRQAAVSPDSGTVYVTGASNLVYVLDVTASPATFTSITVGSNPVYIALSANGAQAYVANNQGGTVSIIDTASKTVTQTVTVGSAPYGIASAVAPPPAPPYVPALPVPLLDPRTLACIAVLLACAGAFRLYRRRQGADPCR